MVFISRESIPLAMKCRGRVKLHPDYAQSSEGTTEMSSGGTLDVVTELEDLINDLAIVGKNTPKHIYLMHKENHRKPVSLKEFSSYNSDMFTPCRGQPRG